MRRAVVGLAVVQFAFAVAASAQERPAAPDPVALLTAASRPFTFDRERLGGPGADHLRRATAGSRFVLFGEMHNDRQVPVFASALYRMLHATHGYRHVVVEQDPVALEELLAPGVRGDTTAMRRVIRRWPGLFEFPSTEDVGFVADAARLVPGPDAIWGVEQTTGAIRYLEELRRLAPTAALRTRVDSLLADARRADPGPGYSVEWLVRLSTHRDLLALRTAFAARPGTRPARLLDDIVRSAEIFGYYTRSSQGEFVGLYNNTVREEVLKGHFLARYREAAKRGPVKAFFKFGANHMYHGRNSTNAFPIGNLAHELAIVEGGHAYGLYVIPLGAGYLSFADLPAGYRGLLPATEPTEPTVIDLRALRPYQRLFRERVPAERQAELLGLLHGFDAIVLLPGSQASTMTP